MNKFLAWIVTKWVCNQVNIISKMQWEVSKAYWYDDQWENHTIKWHEK